jgi:hypothetical protein
MTVVGGPSAAPAPRRGDAKYALALAVPLDGVQVDRLREGIALDEGVATLGGLRPMTTVEVARLTDLLRPRAAGPALVSGDTPQGWKRQLRRMFGAVGAPVSSWSRSDRSGPHRWPAQRLYPSRSRPPRCVARGLAPADRDRRGRHSPR